MNSNYIAVIDSGIGGLSVLKELVKVLPNERYLYFGDNLNAPYGSKSKRELYNITQKNLEYMLPFGIKAVVVACNTLSVNILPIIAPKYRLPFFGVYPPITENKLLALLATPLTCSVYKNRKNIIPVPLPFLATDIEKNKFNLKAVDINRHLKGNNIPRDAEIVLGCTHYCLLKKQFYNHFCPQKITSGNEITAKRVSHCLKINELLNKSESFSIDFIGECAKENKKFYNLVVKTCNY